MGKVRVKTLGVEELEEQEKKETKKRKDSKKILRQDLTQAEKKDDKPEDVIPNETRSVSARQSQTDQDETAASQAPRSDKTEATQEKAPKISKYAQKKTEVKVKKPTRSKKYQAVVALVDRNKYYSLSEALALLPKLKLASFDETVELHINTIEPGISGMVALPHGTGKEVRVAVASDELIEKIAAGKMDFDILISTPQMMPKLAKVAKFLGPKGLMPNPKNGTVTANPDEVIKKFQSGQVRFKTEAKIPVIHMSVGKMSFGEQKLSENIKTLLSAIGTAKMRKVVLKSTMSPGLKISIS